MATISGLFLIIVAVLLGVLVLERLIQVGSATGMVKNK